MLLHIIITINWFILWYLIIISFGYLILFVASLPNILVRYNEDKVLRLPNLMNSHVMPHLTIIIPAFNEEKYIVDTIYSILRSDYPNIDIIVINDGSTDKTLEKLITEFDLIAVTPFIQQSLETSGKIKGHYVSRFLLNFTLIDKEHSLRSDTLNVGINACRTPLCMTLDADTLLDFSAISKAIFYMLIQPNIATLGGGLYVLNGCTFKDGKISDVRIPLNPIYAFQSSEFLRSFLFGRSGWNPFGGSLCYSGAFTCFQRETLLRLGGFEALNLSQDFEIITHLQVDIRERTLSDKLSYTPAAIAFTDVPGTLKEYWNQRFNWQYWSLHSLLKYKKILFNPKYGVTGLFNYPFFLFGEILGAVVEFTAYMMFFLMWYLGILDLYWTLLWIALCWGFMTFLTMATALVSFLTFKVYRYYSDLLLILFYILIEFFGFRQLNILCRTYATFRYFFDKLKSQCFRYFNIRKGLV
jgi:biofilm PGA synthesis N-glycosyltransferase PgaC